MNSKDLFLEARARASMETGPEGGIGTFGEKYIHRTLKYYFEPDDSYHEISVCGSVADICRDGCITEIQTGSFERLVPKLEKFLSEYEVNVVYPIVERKTICRIDQASGEILRPRTSSKKGKAVDALSEIAKIRSLLPNEKLKITLVFIDANETRLQGKNKKVGRKKTDKINIFPTSINRITELSAPRDFFDLLPESLPSEFDSATFGKISAMKSIALHNSLMLLIKLGVLHREKGKGRSYIYYINDR